MDATTREMSIGVTREEAPLHRSTPTWETPRFVEIRMDAEIGSYQDDFDSEDWH